MRDDREHRGECLRCNSDCMASVRDFPPSDKGTPVARPVRNATGLGC